MPADCPVCIGDGYFDSWCPYCDGKFPWCSVDLFDDPVNDCKDCGYVNRCKNIEAVK